LVVWLVLALVLLLRVLLVLVAGWAWWFSFGFGVCASGVFLVVCLSVGLGLCSVFFGLAAFGACVVSGACVVAVRFGRPLFGGCPVLAIISFFILSRLSLTLLCVSSFNFWNSYGLLSFIC
jgi:hypothetical protein